MRTLRDIIESIYDYQAKMGYDYSKMTPEQKLQALRDYHVALNMEQAEMFEEVSWKPWRTVESQKPKPNKRKVALEWVDNLFFLVDQAGCLDLTVDEILDAFDTKLAANLARIESGYSKVRE